MKLEFIKRGADSRLILIFAGWSTDSRYYIDCVADGWDTAVIYDYRDLSMPPIPDQYSTIYIFAYSLGVFAASRVKVDAAVRIAICGSPIPVSDTLGIPDVIFEGTLDGLSERALMKFHLRMAGDKSKYESIKPKFPANADLARLKEELSNILISTKDNVPGNCRFVRAYIAENDRIFPPGNLNAYWISCKDTEIVNLKASHAVDLAAIIRQCLPDTEAIGEGFAGAGMSYIDNAIVQKEICDKICEKLLSSLSSFSSRSVSLLEIGPGSGLLTEGWRRIIAPDKAVYVDLTDMPQFGAAKVEKYFKKDAEKWLEESDERFDIILSASAIQWFADPVRFISTVRNHLKPGGFAILSTFVKGNLHQLDAIRPAPILYRTVEEYASAPADIVMEWERTLKFRTYREMLRHLSLTGISPGRRKSVDSDKDIKGGHSHCENDRYPVQLTFCPLILFVKSKD